MAVIRLKGESTTGHGRGRPRTRGADPARLHIRINVGRFIDVRQASALYRLLGDEARLRLLRVLDQERLNVTELTGILGLAQSGVSRHLRLLKDAGFVSEEKDAGFTYYRLADTTQGRAGALWAALQEQFERSRERPGRAGGRGAAAGGAAAAQGELRAPRGRQPRRAAARAGPQLGGLVARARPAAAAAARRGPRLRRGLSHHRGVALGGERDRRRSIGSRARPRPGARPAPPRVERRVAARRAREASDRGRDGRRRAAVAGAAPRRGSGAAPSPRRRASPCRAAACWSWICGSIRKSGCARSSAIARSDSGTSELDDMLLAAGWNSPGRASVRAGRAIRSPC